MKEKIKFEGSDKLRNKKQVVLFPLSEMMRKFLKYADESYFPPEKNTEKLPEKRK